MALGTYDRLVVHYSPACLKAGQPALNRAGLAYNPAGRLTIRPAVYNPALTYSTRQKKPFHTAVFNHRRYCVVQTVARPLHDRCATVA